MNRRLPSTFEGPDIVNIPRTVVPGSQVGVIMREDCAVARLSCHVRWPVFLGLLS